MKKFIFISFLEEEKYFVTFYDFNTRSSSLSSVKLGGIFNEIHHVRRRKKKHSTKNLNRLAWIKVVIERKWLFHANSLSQMIDEDSTTSDCFIYNFKNQTNKQLPFFWFFFPKLFTSTKHTLMMGTYGACAKELVCCFKVKMQAMKTCSKKKDEIMVFWL